MFYRFYMLLTIYICSTVKEMWDHIFELYGEKQPFLQSQYNIWRILKDTNISHVSFQVIFRFFILNMKINSKFFFFAHLNMTTK